MIQVKRVYTPPARDDGVRFLVERLWPRGMKKEALPLDGWLKEIAPSDTLRHWFGHDPKKWEEFRHRYVTELAGKPEAWRPLLETARPSTVTLLYSARDPDHNSAVVLKSYLEAKLRKKEELRRWKTRKSSSSRSGRRKEPCKRKRIYRPGGSTPSL